MIPICRNQLVPLGSRRSAQFAVIVLHGFSRSPETYYKWIILSVRHHFRAGFSMSNVPGFKRDLIDNVVVAAPHFTPSGHAVARLIPDCAVWDKDWKSMAPELLDEQDGGPPLTPVDAINALVTMFSDRTRFPQMRRVVIIGHSAGAQFVQRYAIANAIDPTGLASQRPGEVQIRYIVVAPNSFVYLDNRRPIDLPPRLRSNYGDFSAVLARKFTFGVPSGGDAAGYNDWKYGLHDMPATLCSAPSMALLVERYLGRDV